MHQKTLACFEAAALKHIGPDGEKRLWQTGCFLEAHAFWHRQGMGGRCRNIFCIAAARKQRTDLVAHGPFTYACANRGHFAACFEPRQIARALGRRIGPCTLQRIRTVYPGISHFDQDFAMARHRTRALGQLQHLRRTRLGYFYHTHRLFLISLPHLAYPSWTWARAPQL